MKRLVLLAIALSAAAWCISAAVTRAEEGDAPKPRKEGEVRKDADVKREGEVRRDGDVRKEGEIRREGERREGEGKGPILRGELARMAEVCALSEEQQKKIAEINQAREKAIAELNARCQGEVMGVLSPGQKAKWNEAVLLGAVQRELKRANLTEDQIAKVKSAIAEQTEDAVLGDEKSRDGAMRKLREFIMKDVLTDAQRAAMREGEGKTVKEGEKREGEGKAQKGGEKGGGEGKVIKDGEKREGEGKVVKDAEKREGEAKVQKEAEKQ